MPAAIEVRDLRKVYDGRIVAVDGVSMAVAAGEVYALLGHNGAGKSTTVEILEGHRSRTAGEVTVLGVDPAAGGRELRDRIGIVLQSSGIEGSLSVREAVTVYGSCYSRRRPIEEVLALAGLIDQADQRIATLSGGQRRRVDLALGIVGYPEVLFLDEPTTGFDPTARRSAWDVVRRLGAGGTTVVLTTHYLDEAEHLADRVGVIADGRLIAEGTPAELIGATSVTVVRVDLPAAHGGDGIESVLPSEATVDGRRLEFST
nr:ABC transporter ATP-binding protein [Acidimicrobiia bacterium]